MRPAKHGHEIIWGLQTLLGRTMPAIVALVTLTACHGTSPKLEFEPTPEFRARLLHGRAADFGLKSEKGEVWGIVMDSGEGYNGAALSLLVLKDGRAGFYIDRAGAGYGDARDERLWAPVERLVVATRNVAPRAASSLLDHSPPPPRDVRFYLLKDGGTVAVDAVEQDVWRSTHPLAELYAAGQAIISRLKTADALNARAI